MTTQDLLSWFYLVPMFICWLDIYIVIKHKQEGMIEVKSFISAALFLLSLCPTGNWLIAIGVNAYFLFTVLINLLEKKK